MASQSVELEITSTDMHDPDIVAVILQQRFAKGEEGGVRQTVIFQNDSFFHLGKEPVYRGAYTQFTTEMLIQKTGMKRTRPVNFLDDISYSGAFFRFSRYFCAWCVCGDKQLLRSLLPNLFKNLQCSIQTIKQEKEDGSFHREKSCSVTSRNIKALI